MITNPYYDPYWKQNCLSDELEHHGVKGQSWGERNGPPYPLSRGKDGRITKTQKKKKASLLARAKNALGGKKSVSKTKKTKESKEEESTEKIREKLLKSTDPKYIAKHIDLLDTRELKERLDRINTEQQLRKLTQSNNKKKVDAGMEWVNNLGKIADTTSKVAKAYSDTIDATTKKSKVKYEEAERKQNLATKSKASKAMLGLLGEYKTSSEAFKDVEVKFDPKTGTLSFKSNKK